MSVCVKVNNLVAHGCYQASHNELRQNYEHLLAKHTENDKDLSEATAHLQAQNMSLQVNS